MLDARRKTPLLARRAGVPIRHNTRSAEQLIVPGVPIHAPTTSANLRRRKSSPETTKRAVVASPVRSLVKNGSNPLLLGDRKTVHIAPKKTSGDLQSRDAQNVAVDMFDTQEIDKLLASDNASRTSIGTPSASRHGTPSGNRHGTSSAGYGRSQPVPVRAANAEGNGADTTRNLTVLKRNRSITPSGNTPETKRASVFQMTPSGLRHSSQAVNHDPFATTINTTGNMAREDSTEVLQQMDFATVVHADSQAGDLQQSDDHHLNFATVVNQPSAGGAGADEDSPSMQIVDSDASSSRMSGEHGRVSDIKKTRRISTPVEDWPAEAVVLAKVEKCQAFESPLPLGYVVQTLTRDWEEEAILGNCGL